MAKTYSPKDVKIVVGGFQDVSGWTSITVDRNSDNSSTIVSADGVPAHTVIADNTGTFEIELQQHNSEFNMCVAALDLKTKTTNDLLFFDITITDRSGSELVNLKDVHLRKMAPQALAAEAGTRTHMFHVDNVQYLPAAEGISETASEVLNANNFVDFISEQAQNLQDLTS
ncbi:hypothetical protein [Pseudoalteromonas phage J2-1]|uniref:Uncharacterized protein n=1 Tax=Pseudoalteromonas phage J2-1 TaxID=2023998 RepID=A0A223LHB5_9CAUD|nr:virion structural protein [Pseudoalteromonas phage J2-1]ASU03372.1 hypothetical protein [Pseudoalteromonas phage J2-1]